MGDQQVCRKGDWVQVHQIVLQATQRASGVPEDTAKVPLQMWVKGFAQSEALLGSQVTIITPAGRQITAQLVAINPAYEHGFGRPVPELLQVAADLRERYRKGE